MEEKILDMLVCQRLDVIEYIVEEDEEYRTIRKGQIQLQEKLETMGLTKEQKEIVQELLDKTNQNSAVYGKLVYRQGFIDGAKLMCELNED